MQYNVGWTDHNGQVQYARVKVTIARDKSKATIDIIRPDWRLGNRSNAFNLVVNTLLTAGLLSRVRQDEGLANTSLAIFPGSPIVGHMWPKRGVSNPGWKAVVVLDKS